MPDKTTDRDARWDALTAPFPQDWIEKLPKVLRRDDADKGRCENSPRGRQYSADGHFCNGWHSRAVHLDYVGHAGITMRLNDAVGPENWSWEPYVNTPDGLPGWKRDEFWIKLTILGVTKIGVGDDSSSPKVLIGDALRNAAMRFGVGTYLWSKSDIAGALAAYSEPDPSASGAEVPPANPGPETAGAVAVEDTPPSAPEPVDKPMTSRTRGRMFALFNEQGIDDEDEQRRGISHIIKREIKSRGELTEGEALAVIGVLKSRPMPKAEQ